MLRNGNSSYFRKAILTILRTKLCCLHRNLITIAEWCSDSGLAQVAYPLGGGWDSFGFSKKNSGGLYLYPEEALFLLETVKNISRNNLKFLIKS